MSTEPPDRQISLESVLQILDKHEVAPDGYYRAKLHDRLVGWHHAVSNIRAAVEALAGD